MTGREIYATDGIIELVKVTESEKDNYIKLFDLSEDIRKYYGDEKTDDLVWRVMRNLDESDYSIYYKGEYCGNISLKNPDSSTPEIGIRLLEHKRNQGIGPLCIKLLTRTAYKERDDIEYFLWKVERANEHSRHVIEKLGAENIGKEDTYLKKILDKMRNQYDEDEYNKIVNSYEENKRHLNGEEFVCVYRLMPKSFLE